MKLKDVINLCTEAVPQDQSWTKTSSEIYGAQNIADPEKEVKKVLFCVTPGFKVSEYFKKGGYDLLISHHPYRAEKNVPQFIAHTALDCCPGGLNDVWRDALDLKEAKHFDDNLGWYGELVTPMTFEELKQKVKDFSGDIIGETYIAEGVDLIRSVVICSGLGGLVLKEALACGADCYILGENTRPADTTGFKAVIEIGHTLSERMGSKFFEKLLAAHDIQVDCAPLEIDRFGSEVYKSARSYQADVPKQLIKTKKEKVASYNWQTFFEDEGC